MKRFALACCVLAQYTLSAQPVIFQHPLSPRIANYDIDVRLDSKQRLLHGHETLRWFNKTKDTIRELRFHLYLNAFRNSRSTFLKEAGGSSRGLEIEKDGWGFTQIDTISLNGGENLSHRLEFIHPDDDNSDDKSVVRFPLSTALRPNDSIRVTIDFTAKLPSPPFARTGAKEEYFFIGQWFPKVGVYIDGKWNCHQFHATTEFFADFGVYNVRMTVPEKNIVGATGLEYEVKNNGDGTATHSYHAEDVHDFAWTISPEYVEFKGREQDVDIRVLMQPDHASQGMRHLEAAKVAIRHFQDWYGDYPFPNLTVVDPRRGAGGSGGMEYPTLITAGTFYGVPDGFRSVENVIIHEFGHNYWYHLLASNEFEESWLDEGINTYTEIQIMNDAYGPTGDGIDVLGLKLNTLQYQRGSFISGPDLDPVVKNAWQYYSGNSYGVNSYSRPGMILTTLQNYLGRDVMMKIMRAYVERWRFKHPKSKDFVTVASDVAGQNLDWFFDQALYTNAVLDYSVDRVRTRLVTKSRGFDFTQYVTDRDDSSKSSKADESNSSSDNDKDSVKTYLSEISIRRLGTFTFPVDVEMKFENGETIREHWDGKDLWKKYKYLKPVKLVSATVDPDHVIPLDINYTNNSKVVDPSSLGITKTSIRLLYWTQSFFDQPEWLNLYTFLTNLF